MSGTGYMGVPLPELWDVLAAFPLTYVRDTANALKTMIEADALPHRIYNLSRRPEVTASKKLGAIHTAAKPPKQAAARKNHWSTGSSNATC